MIRDLICKRCGEGYSGDLRTRYCASCRKARRAPTFQRVERCLECGVDIRSRHFHSKFCLDCSAKSHRRLASSYRYNPKNDNEMARKITKYAIRIGYLLPPDHFDCVDCLDAARRWKTKVRKAKCYDHRDYNDPLKVDPVCLNHNSSRGRGIPFHSPVNSRSDTQAA